MGQVRGFDVSQMSGVLIVCGHYGVGKTALSLALAKDAAHAGKRVTLVDLDVVNPYFRSSDQAESLREAGISVITPVYAGPDCNIDMPALTGAIVPAVERAQSEENELCIIDVGGDDSGAAALGRFSRTIASAPYEMWYVVNRYRALTRKAREACEVLFEIESSSRLSATGVVANSHLMGDTNEESISRSLPFAREVAQAAGLPLVFVCVPATCSDATSARLSQEGVDVALYAIDPYRQTPWSN